MQDNEGGQELLSRQEELLSQERERAFPPRSYAAVLAGDSCIHAILNTENKDVLVLCKTKT